MREKPKPDASLFHKYNTIWNTSYRSDLFNTKILNDNNAHLLIYTNFLQLLFIFTDMSQKALSCTL